MRLLVTPKESQMGITQNKKKESNNNRYIIVTLTYQSECTTRRASLRYRKETKSDHKKIIKNYV